MCVSFFNGRASGIYIGRTPCPPQRFWWGGNLMAHLPWTQITQCLSLLWFPSRFDRTMTFPPIISPLDQTQSWVWLSNFAAQCGHPTSVGRYQQWGQGPMQRLSCNGPGIRPRSWSFDSSQVTALCSQGWDPLLMLMKCGYRLKSPKSF